MDVTEFDRDVRLYIYEHFLVSCNPPSVAESALMLGQSEDAIRAAYRRLHEGRSIVLKKGSDDILMASPLSAVQTRFRVTVKEKAYWANCIWDALGIPVMLDRDALITARCGDCDEPLYVRVEGGRVSGEGLIHFGVPARHWWDDIEFT